MPNLINEVGNRYGRLTVIERASNGGSGEARWLCGCECGRQVSVIGCLLRRGTTKSCGCLRSESVSRATDVWRLPKGEAALNWVYGDAQRRAKRYGVAWELDKEQFREIVNMPCFYCGVEGSNHHDRKGVNGGIKYNGIDRVDNARGYVLDNVVACCRACNIAKNDRSVTEFREWAKRLYRHWADEGCS